MIKHAALVTVVATAGLLYTALTHEPDLTEFDRKELESLIKSKRPALAVNRMIEDHRQQFARLMMDYAEHENERLVARALSSRELLSDKQNKSIATPLWRC